MRLDQFSGLVAFLKVAEKGNFRAAALELGLSPSALSQAIKQLESRLGVILFFRTTRSLRLTDVGLQFLNEMKPAAKQLFSSMDQLGHFSKTPTGLLRITLPTISVKPLIEPLIEKFLRAYPDVTLELYVDDDFNDIVSEGFDAGIRMGETIAKDMTVVKLTPPFRFVVAGSPQYLKRNGTPLKVEDLLRHSCIRYRFRDGEIYDKWELKYKGKEVGIEVGGSLIVNQSALSVDAAVNGAGLIYQAENLLEPHLRSGKLRLVLEPFSVQSEGFSLYFPSRSQVQPKLRAFIDFLKNNLKK